MAFFISFPSLLTMNTALAIVTGTTAVFALGLLFYTLFINPPFKNNDNNNNEMITNDVIGITPSRLAANNNLILVPSNKESIIDLKGFGLENNDYVPPEPIVRSSREIEAQLHLNLEQAIIDADTNGTFFGESLNSTIATTTNFTESSSLPPPSSTSNSTNDRASAEATIDFTEESETIEPKFEKVLAFPECKKTKDGKRFC